VNPSDELLAPFTTAVGPTVREMAGLEADVRNVARAEATVPRADVAVAIRLDAEMPGWLAVALPAATAAAFARRILNETGIEPDATMVRDCAGELLNVIAGQAKAWTVDTPGHFALGTPTAVPLVPADWWVLRCGSEAGDFEVYVIPPRAANSGV
jgi:CheY-specific phosphatase CheX